MKHDQMDEDEFLINKLLEDRGNNTGRAEATLTKCHNQRFANPVTESDILSKIEGAVPRSTRKTTLWAVNAWESWRDHH